MVSWQNLAFNINHVPRRYTWVKAHEFMNKAKKILKTFWGGFKIKTLTILFIYTCVCVYRMVFRWICRCLYKLSLQFIFHHSRMLFLCLWVMLFTPKCMDYLRDLYSRTWIHFEVITRENIHFIMTQMWQSTYAWF